MAQDMGTLFFGIKQSILQFISGFYLCLGLSTIALKFIEGCVCFQKEKGFFENPAIVMSLDLLSTIVDKWLNASKEAVIQKKV